MHFLSQTKELAYPVDKRTGAKGMFSSWSSGQWVLELGFTSGHLTKELTFSHGALESCFLSASQCGTRWREASKTQRGWALIGGEDGWLIDSDVDQSQGHDTQAPSASTVQPDALRFCFCWTLQPQGSICPICTGGRTHLYDFPGGGNKISH